ncbi:MULTISPECIES: type IV pilin protein [unclassified Pseudomonas]|uniref:type IV pilin protein n=1 Tax=unclassified Pseudomonas TaxID=196821 RepID=UPI002448DE00|nr:type IV pilin protein [Pseudomonas sp. GD03944]
MNKQNGFTLLELVIAIVIIGILVAIAIPQYTSYLEKAACEDGKSLLLQGSAVMERSRARNNGAYNANVALPGNTKEFGIAVGSVTASAYTLTATAIGRLSGDLTLTATNARNGSLKAKCSW